MRLLLVLLASIILGLIGVFGFCWILLRGIKAELFGPSHPDPEGQSAIDQLNLGAP